MLDQQKENQTPGPTLPQEDKPVVDQNPVRSLPEIPLLPGASPQPQQDDGINWAQVIGGVAILYGAGLVGEAAAAGVIATAYFVPAALPVVVPVVEAFETFVVIPAASFGLALLGEGLHWWDIPWIK